MYLDKRLEKEVSRREAADTLNATHFADKLDNVDDFLNQVEQGKIPTDAHGETFIAGNIYWIFPSGRRPMNDELPEFCSDCGSPIYKGDPAYIVEEDCLCPSCHQDLLTRVEERREMERLGLLME